MSLLSRRRDYGGPREPSAAERGAPAVGRAAVRQPCDACHTHGPTHHITTVTQIGPIHVCLDPVACRIRATQAGIWGRYPR